MSSNQNRGHCPTNVRASFQLLVAAMVLLVGAISADAVPIYQGGSGYIVFGVSPYAGPAPGAPTYIPNNFSGQNDILASPGGTFLEANPVVGNNIFSFPAAPPPAPHLGGVALPAFGFQIGGGNINGPFGGGYIVETGQQVGFSLFDLAAGGGSASYGIATWDAVYTDVLGTPAGNIGSYLAMGGVLPNINTAGVAALRTRLESANAASPFSGGFELPQLILAAARTPGDIYSTVALGGPAGANAAVVIDNAVLGTYRGLAINNVPLPFAIPAGDVITATSTLTIYADPSEMAMLDQAGVADLVAMTGTDYADFSFVESTIIPEPSTAVMLIVALAAGCSMRRRSC